MQTQTTILSKKLRAKFVDHLDGFMIAQLITERFHGPFVTWNTLLPKLRRAGKKITPKTIDAAVRWARKQS